MKEYPHEFWESGAHGRGLRLLSRSGVTDGVVLDLGCASGPLAEPVAELGLHYVGADVDRHALDDLERRGFEAHQLDLSLDEDTLVAALEDVLAGRDLAAVLLLDVVEHLVDPAPLLGAVARLDAKHDGIALVVSIPNVTHLDVGIKLLLGRWDMTAIGLLDDTHVRFFSERRVRETMASSGWVEVDADDVVNAFSDQLFPADAPALRPGAPLRQVLWRVRMAADPFGETYQYVRRFERDPSAAAEIGAAPVQSIDGAPFLSVIVRSTGGEPGALDRLVRDFAIQTDDDVEILVTRPSGIEAGADHPDPRVTMLSSGQDMGWRNDAVAAARGRYVVFLDDTTRVAAGFVETIRRADEALPSRVVRTASAVASRTTLDEARHREFADVLEDTTTVDMEPLDLVTMAPFGSLVLGAHAVPREACVSNGLRFVADDEAGAATLFVIRAVELCGIVRPAECVSVVDAATVREVATDLPFVAEHLDQVPLVLPEGAGSQLLALRRTLASLVPERDELAQSLAAANEQITTLSWLVRAKDDELDHVNHDVQRLRAEARRHVSTRIRRRLGNVLRRI